MDKIHSRISVDSGFFCATATVPLGYAHSDSETISLAVIKHPATDPACRYGLVYPKPFAVMIRSRRLVHPSGGGVASVFVLVRPCGRGDAAGVASNVRGGRRCAAVMRPSE